MKDAIAEQLQEHQGLINLVVFNAMKRIRGMQYAGVPFPADLLDEEEMRAEVLEVFVKAQQKFDPSLNYAFSTYFVRSANNQINRRINNLSNRYINPVSMHVSREGEDDDYEIELPEEGDFTQGLELNDLVNFVKGNLSPLARALFEMSLQPHAVFEREYEAHKAKRDYASSLGLSRHLVREMNLNFIATCLKLTISSREEKEFIDKAVREIKRVVYREL